MAFQNLLENISTVPSPPLYRVCWKNCLTQYKVLHVLWREIKSRDEQRWFSFPASAQLWVPWWSLWWFFLLGSLDLAKLGWFGSSRLLQMCLRENSENYCAHDRLHLIEYCLKIWRACASILGYMCKRALEGRYKNNSGQIYMWHQCFRKKRILREKLSKIFIVSLR